jgi:two-component system phosphate regulon sensor histidine kinase PhoR
MSLIAYDKIIMQALLSGMVDGVLVVDVDGCIAMANRAAENIFLAREGALEGKLLASINENAKINEMIRKVLRTGKEVFVETVVRPSTKIYRVHVVAIKESEENIKGAMAVFHDVTDVRNFDQVRSDFVGNVSHELRTPLTSIKGFVETLLDGAMEDGILCRRFLSIIDTETERLSRLIDDLLSLYP